MDHDRIYTPLRYAEPPDPKYDGSRRRSGRKILILGMLVALMLATIAGTAYLEVRLLHGESSVQRIPSVPVAIATATPDRSLPINNGWTPVAPTGYGSIQFSEVIPERGYLCGSSSDGATHVFGVTTDRGQTWSIGNSPASYMTCSLQLSPGYPLDLTLNSINEPGDGQLAYIDAHFTTDGGKSWRAAPIPQKTLMPGGLLWSGTYLYLWYGNTLRVSNNGGPFTPLGLSTILPGEADVYLTSMVAASDTLYLNLQTKACQSPCNILVASSNGGASWTKAPDDGDIFLEQVVGNSFYGRVLGSQPFVTSVLRSDDGGASWQTISFPPLPNDATTSDYYVAPDQTIYTSSLAGVAALRNGAWTILPVSSSDLDGMQVTAVSLDANGHPQKIWGYDDGKHPGVYWHSLE
ncbi:MAG TPA: hypothetical protein VH591_19160 [Ktedonobacterales bacterium]